MNVLFELSKKNNYQPDLTNPQESCERTYRQAIDKLEKNMNYINGIDVLKLTPEKTYDICNEVAADLALCCELFLKAIYIYEHNLNGEDINTIWENISTTREIRDINGNKIYVSENGTISYIQVDSEKRIIYDAENNPKLADKDGNPIEYKSKGKVVKKNGHDLDYLITSVISLESRVLLEIMITANLIEETEQHKRVDLIDILASRGILQENKKIPNCQYKSWLEQHAQTFIDSRYAGQNYHQIEVAFLYHLATQCRALAEYRIEPSKQQQVELTEDEIEKMPEVIKKLALNNKNLFSQGLTKLTIEDEEKRKKLEILVDNGIINAFSQVQAPYFQGIIQYFEMEEITFICKILITKYQKEDEKHNQTMIVKLLSGLNPNEFIKICIYLKQRTNHPINEKLFEDMLGSEQYDIYNNYSKLDYNYKNDYNGYIDPRYINNYKYKL